MKLLHKPIRTAAFFFSLCLVFTVLCGSLKTGEKLSSRYPAFSVRFEFFGTDAAEMERLITIPLEEKIGGMSGIVEMRSVSEYGRAVLTVYLEKNTDEKRVRTDLREAVDSLYAVLPRAVQKPRIFSSSSETRPIFSLALQSQTMDINMVRRFAENNLKPVFEGLDGCAEVTVSGGSVEEIKITFDPERAVSGSVNPNILAAIIQDSNVLTPGIFIKTKPHHESIQFNTRIHSLSELRDLPVPIKNAQVKLSNLASIERSGRSRDEIVRINGRESIAVAVKASSSANVTLLSRQCRSVIADLADAGIEATVLYDRGAVTEKIYSRILFAVLQSFILVIFFLPFFFRKIQTLLFTALVLPFAVLGTAALLSVLSYPADRHVLAGISVALGLAVDSALVVAELAEEKHDNCRFSFRFRSTLPSLVSSAATGILVLIPLYFFDYMIPGIRAVVITLGTMLSCSLLFSVIFLPVFFTLKIPPLRPDIAIIPEYVFKKISRFYLRISYLLILFGLKHNRFSRICYGIFMILPFILFFTAGKNLFSEQESGVVNFYVEFESEKSAASIDAQTVSFIREIEKLDGVLYVSSEAKKGALEAEVSFEKTDRRSLARKIDELSALLYEGYLYIPDLVQDKTADVTEIEVALTGDDQYVCRSLARQAAKTVSENGIAEQTVLNFKEEEKTLFFIPDRIKLEKNGLNVFAAAGNLRWLMFGPVTDKWLNNGEETDIRILGKNLQAVNQEQAANIQLPVKNGGVRIGVLGDITRSSAVGKIYRKDGRRASYFTSHIRASSTDKALSTLKKTLDQIQLPKGYGFSFPVQLERLSREYRLLLLIFIFCTVLVLVLLTALYENFFESLLICSIIPVSVCLPLLLRFATATPLAAADMIGMVIVSGMSVNNVIYILSSLHTRIVFCVRSKIKSILASSVTGIAGSLPLMLSGIQDFSKSLGFFLFFGSLASLLASLCLFPSVIQHKTGFFVKKK